MQLLLLIFQENNFFKIGPNDLSIFEDIEELVY